MNQRTTCNMHPRFLHRLCSSTALACCWFCGLLIGFLYGRNADPSYFYLMRMAASSCMSIVGLLTALCLPFLISALAVFLMRPQWMLLICFLKAFTFACCGCALTAAFGSAGWLVRILLQFSDCCTIPFFYWFCMRNLSGFSTDTPSDLRVCGIALMIVGTLDFCVISPFLVKLIDN